MATRNILPLLLVILIPLIILAGACDQIGRALPLPTNPYANLLDTPYTTIAGYSRCYPPAPEYSAYCVHDLERGSIAFSLSNGLVRYVSVSGTSSGVRVGDLVSLYGQPTGVHKARYFVTWVWQDVSGLRIIASSRRVSLFEPVRWLSMSRIGG